MNLVQHCYTNVVTLILICGNFDSSDGTVLHKLRSRELSENQGIENYFHFESRTSNNKISN